MIDGNTRKSCRQILQEQLEKLKSSISWSQRDFYNRLNGAVKELPDPCTTVDDYLSYFKEGSLLKGEPKAVTAALDALQEFLANEFLSAIKPDPAQEDPAGGRILMDVYIDLVCKCAEQQDDQVQLHILRAILTAVTSKKYGWAVRNKSLMLAVQTCFMLHRDSKNETAQRTAQASLTQMLSVILKRVELPQNTVIRETTMGLFSPPTVERSIPDEIPVDEALEEFMTSYVNKLVDDVAHESGGSEPDRGNFGYCFVCRDPAKHYSVDTGYPVCTVECMEKNLKNVRTIDGIVASPSLPSSGKPYERKKNQKATIPVPATEVTFVRKSSSLITEGTIGIETNGDLPFYDDVGASILLAGFNRDAFMVFNSFVRYSGKDLPTSGDGVATKHIRSKRFALDLLHDVIVNSGPVFRSSERFTSLVRSLLELSLLKNCLSPVAKIYNQALRIFEILIKNFRDNVRGEIGVFIETVMLPILGSGNSTFSHKHRVLKVLYKICTDVWSVLDIFVNFDCNVDERNIFETTLDCLAKIGQGRYLQSEHANVIQPQQEMELKMLALDTMVTLVGYMVEKAEKWKKDHSEKILDESSGKQNESDEGEDELDEDEDANRKGETTGNGLPAPVSTSMSKNPSYLVEQKQRKALLIKGVHKFNLKPKVGLKYFLSHNFIEDDNPEDVARFFVQTDGLSKTQLGDFLGENDPFNKQVLHALVDRDSFQGLELDNALRKFLSNFRLPGEAQKIDRMMEKFAEKYHMDNPDIGFANADTAYVLSFSIIMLNTDAHSDQIKNKMTKESFVKTNRGIDNGKDCPKEFLEKLYDNILKEPISLGEDDMSRIRLASEAAFGPAQKFDLFIKETQIIVQKTKHLMREQRTKEKNVVRETRIEFIGPLFEVICWPLLATLSVTLETLDDEEVVDLCIKGFKFCTRLAGWFDMITERDAFVSSLAKFTYLATQMKGMRPKNVKCIKTLLQLGLTDGNILGSSWYYVLFGASQLERLQMKASEVPEIFDRKSYTKQEQIRTPLNSPVSVRRFASTNSEKGAQYRCVGTGVVGLKPMTSDEIKIDNMNSESVLNSIDATLIDRLFDSANKLDSKGIVSMVTELCRICKEELLSEVEPRIFSLQKLVEVADSNMSRMRIVWSRIWKVLCQHFIDVACHPNMCVSMYVIDSLRQLAMKFLEKDELSSYQFQCEFLRPFQVVMETPHAAQDTKELVVSIVSNMVQARARNIKSGWQTIFAILIGVVKEHSMSEEQVAQSFDIVSHVAVNNFSLFLENYHGGIQALISFGFSNATIKCEDGEPPRDLSAEALRTIRKCAENLGKLQVKEREQGRSPSGTVVVKPINTARESTGTGGSKSSTSLARALGLPPSGGSHTNTNSMKPSRDSGGSVTMKGHSNVTRGYWFELLRGLASLALDKSSKERRTNSMMVLFECLHYDAPKVFDEDMWEQTFREILFPLLDEIFAEIETPNKGLDANDCFQALDNTVKIYNEQSHMLKEFLPEILGFLKGAILNQPPAVAKVGVESFKNFLLGDENLETKNWNLAMEVIHEVMKESLPHEILEDNSSPENMGFNAEAVVGKVESVNLLVQAIADVIEAQLEEISSEAIVSVSQALDQCIEFSQVFNRNIAWRHKLQVDFGFHLGNGKMPGLMEMESLALACYGKMLFRLTEFKNRDVIPDLTKRCGQMCQTILHNFIKKERQLLNRGEDSSNDTAEMQNEMDVLASLVCDVILVGLAEFAEFDQMAVSIFPLLVDLCLSQNRNVRMKVREVMLVKVEPLVKKATKDSS